MSAEEIDAAVRTLVAKRSRLEVNQRQHARILGFLEEALKALDLELARLRDQRNTAVSL